MRSLTYRPERIRLRSSERILFVKRLALYLNAGIPLFRALHLIREGVRDKHHQHLLTSLLERIGNGTPLSEAVGVFPRAYAPITVHTIMVAEMSGTLPTTLRWHAELLSRQQALRHSLLGALIYPGIILVGTVVTSSFLILYAFPKIVPLFRGFHTKLPFTTRTLIWISTPSSTHSEYLLLGLMVPLVLGVVLSYSKTARRHTYRATLRLPLIGGLMREYTLTTLFTMLALLLQSGIRMDVAIELLRKTTSRSLFKESLLHMQNTVLAGGKLSQSMRTHTLLYPSLYIELIAAGEESGSLVESTQTAAHLCETSLEERLHALSVLVEPILMILLGFVVGFVALAIISPMYSLTQTLSTT